LAQNTSRPGQECGKASDSLCNPIQVNGVGDVKTFVAYAMSYAGGLIGLVAIATLVYAGIRMVTANGNDKTISEAKQTVTYALTGLVLSVLAYAGVAALENLIGVQTTTNSRNVVFNPFGSLTLKGFAENLLQNVIKISGVLSLLMIIWYGFRYTTARGDDKQVSSAKTGIIWSLVGLILILFSYVIIKAIANLIS
jgi:glucose uptake protein GlcU